MVTTYHNFTGYLNFLKKNRISKSILFSTINDKEEIKEEIKKNHRKFRAHGGGESKRDHRHGENSWTEENELTRKMKKFFIEELGARFDFHGNLSVHEPRPYWADEDVESPVRSHVSGFGNFFQFLYASNDVHAQRRRNELLNLISHSTPNEVLKSYLFRKEGEWYMYKIFNEMISRCQCRIGVSCNPEIQEILISLFRKILASSFFQREVKWESLKLSSTNDPLAKIFGGAQGNFFRGLADLLIKSNWPTNVTSLSMMLTNGTRLVDIEFLTKLFTYRNPPQRLILKLLRNFIDNEQMMIRISDSLPNYYNKEAIELLISHLDQKNIESLLRYLGSDKRSNIKDRIASRDKFLKWMNMHTLSKSMQESPACFVTGAENLPDQPTDILLKLLDADSHFKLKETGGESKSHGAQFPRKKRRSRKRSRRRKKSK